MVKDSVGTIKIHRVRCQRNIIYLSFKVQASDDVMIDAIKFRCKRQNLGLGYFGINDCFFIKGAGNFTINTPYVYSAWFSGANNPFVSGSVAECIIII